MSRVRRLNISSITSGFQSAPFLPRTGAWNLEIELEPRFTKKTPVHLLFPMAPPIPFSSAADVLTDASLVVLTDGSGNPLTTS